MGLTGGSFGYGTISKSGDEPRGLGLNLDCLDCGSSYLCKIFTVSFYRLKSFIVTGSSSGCQGFLGLLCAFQPSMESGFKSARLEIKKFADRDSPLLPKLSVRPMRNVQP